MTYASLEDLIDRAGAVELRQIADRDRDGSVDMDVVTSALEDADSMINRYVAVKYDVPLPSVPSSVRGWAVSIARYLLHRNGAPDHVARDYKDARADLKDVASGLSALPVAAGEAAPSVTGGAVMAAHPPRIFTPGKLRGWR